MSVYTYEHQWVFIHMKINDFTAMKYYYFIYGYSSFTVASKNGIWLNDTKKKKIIIHNAIYLWDKHIKKEKLKEN